MLLFRQFEALNSNSVEKQHAKVYPCQVRGTQKAP